jgi:hypothetical protein
VGKKAMGLKDEGVVFTQLLSYAVEVGLGKLHNGEIIPQGEQP